MTYATLREALYDFFFTHNAPLVSDGGYYSSEDVFTALPYEKGRRYFDAVALAAGGYGRDSGFFTLGESPPGG